jgi:hypothetical protein
LRVQAIPRRGSRTGAFVHVIVEVPGGALRMIDSDGRRTARVSLALRAIDDRARAVHDLMHTIDLNLTAEEADEIATTGVRWIRTMELAPGHYSLRVAGAVGGVVSVGSVFADIDVPRFSHGEPCPPLLPELCSLRIAGLAVTSPSSDSFVTEGTPSAALGLPTSPTTARTFVSGEVLTVSADLATPQGFWQGVMHLTVHHRAALPAHPALIGQTVDLADAADAHRTQRWTVDTGRIGTGEFVLRLSVREAGSQFAEAALRFDVVER